MRRRVRKMSPFGWLILKTLLPRSLIKLKNVLLKTKYEGHLRPSWHLPAQSWRRSGAFIANIEHNSHLVLVFLLLTLNM